MTKPTKQQLRQAIIQQRGTLAETDLVSAALALKNTALSHQKLLSILTKAKHILSYSAFRGEISPHLLIENLAANIHLPKIVDYKNKKMQFYPADQELVANRYGILEPVGTGEPTLIAKCDVILIPLVAFDRDGNRIGMGAGFYDRALSNLSKSNISIGLAHDFQQLESIKSEVWDVPINAILTNQNFIDPAKLFHC